MDCILLDKEHEIYGVDAEHAKHYRESGANIFWIGNDVAYIRAGIDKMLSDIFE